MRTQRFCFPCLPPARTHPSSSTRKPVHSFPQIQCSSLWHLFQCLHLLLGPSQRLVNSHFDFHIIHLLFRQPIQLALLQTPSFRRESLPLAPPFWIHLTAIPALPVVFLRWSMSPLPSPLGAQPLHQKTSHLLWPSFATIQSLAHVPSLSFAKRSRLSTLHAPPSWPPNPTQVLSESMTSSTHFSLSERRFAQRTTLPIGVWKGPAQRLANWMRTPMNPPLEFRISWPYFTSRTTTVRSDAGICSMPSFPTWLRIVTPIFHSLFSHPISMQVNYVLPAPARFSRPTSISSRTFRTHLDLTRASS